jgi:NAD(P)-dependent dehydrogenase (short-subunit alcohol dehydrogenase family)
MMVRRAPGMGGDQLMPSVSGIEEDSYDDHSVLPMNESRPFESQYRPVESAPAPQGGPEVVVVTGASAGVGRAVIRRFAREGAHIALLARGVDGLEGARREVEEAGGKALVLPTDVARWDEVERAAAQTEEAFGPIDIWINNAMTSVFSPVREMHAYEYRRVMEVTYLGTVHGTLAALHRMLPRDRGSIVQVGSALAYRGIPLQSAYCAAKHATQGFMDSLYSELIHDGSHVRVCMVHLPAMNTPQFDWVRSRLPRKAQPVPPIFQPEVAADGIFWAAHNDRRELWVGGPTVQAIVANRIAPGVLDHVLARNGYDAQQTNEPEDPRRPDNLWRPVAGDHGAHGRFSDRAADHSAQLWAATHRSGIALGVLVGIGVGLAAIGLAGKRAVSGIFETPLRGLRA